VITSNFGAMKEAAGDGALFVDPYSVEATREAILRVKNEPGLREELIAKGLRNAAKFSADAVALKYAQIYRNLAKAGAKHKQREAQGEALVGQYEDARLRCAKGGSALHRIAGHAFWRL